MKEKSDRIGSARMALTQEGADLMLWQMLGAPELRDIKRDLYEQMPLLPKAPLKGKPTGLKL